MTIIDTPGHQAFENLRYRGAHVSDIILLVISACEGIKPQTLEAIDVALRFKIPLVVALNMIDRAEADPN